MALAVKNLLDQQPIPAKLYLLRFPVQARVVSIISQHLNARIGHTNISTNGEYFYPYFFGGGGG